MKFSFCSLLAFTLFSIGVQVFFPYLIVYFQHYLKMDNYALVLGVVLLFASVVSVLAGRYLDKYGKQYRPHIVFFGEAVPNIEPATRMVEEADILLVIGTSLNVYPAAGLLYYARPDAEVYYIDPKADSNGHLDKRIHCISEKAGAAVPELVKQLLEKA